MKKIPQYNLVETDGKCWIIFQLEADAPADLVMDAMKLLMATGKELIKQLKVKDTSAKVSEIGYVDAGRETKCTFSVITKATAEMRADACHGAYVFLERALRTQ